MASEGLMRRSWLGLVLSVAVLLPIKGNAQVFQFRTPAPDVSAAGADWQMSGEPLIVGGLTYYATRVFRLFDGQVMVQTGFFDNVPVYADTTVEPYSEVYVPIGGGRMRLYERRREGELAGTTGSHVPSFPVESPSVPPRERMVGATGVMGDWDARSRRAVSERPIDVEPLHTLIINGVPHTPDANGVWVEFNGARWFSDGRAVSFSSDRFEPVGEYHGFPVYRDAISGSADIWVAVVKDGPLAPYRKQ
jgi:hypothetical protein